MQGVANVFLCSLLLAGAICKLEALKTETVRSEHQHKPELNTSNHHKPKHDASNHHKRKKKHEAAPARLGRTPEDANPQQTPEDLAKAPENQPATEVVAFNVHPGFPSEPGCYMKMPSGCPKQPMRTEMWRHDTWAEQNNVDERGCQKRKRTWDMHCESEDAKMLYIASNGTELSALQFGLRGKWPWHWFGFGKHKKEEVTEAVTEAVDSAVRDPLQPGCYMRMPSGCPKHPMRTYNWRHDAWAEQNNYDEPGCKGRKLTWDQHCETGDAQMFYVANHTATEPVSTLLQLRVTWPWSRKNKKTQVTETAQPPAMDAAFDALEKYPSQPGCYMKMPSGCPKKPMKTDTWRHDTWAEQHDLDEASCMQRKTTWDKYCDSGDAKVVYIPKQ